MRGWTELVMAMMAPAEAAGAIIIYPHLHPVTLSMQEPPGPCPLPPLLTTPPRPRPFSEKFFVSSSPNIT